MARAAYIHIPFCAHKCDFCDFAAFAGVDDLQESYCNVVIKEIRERMRRQPNEEKLQSVFYGGGTPGYLDAGLLGLVHEALMETVGIASDAEVSLETTPHAITAAKARAWQQIGINRLSIGIESLQDDELKSMGRDHNREEALAGVTTAGEAGFTNIAIDLMYGLPLQTPDSWALTLEDALALETPHLSAYGLTLSHSSPLLRRFPRDSGAYAADDVFVGMYGMLVSACEQVGLKQYEISNFSKPGFESRHNLTYWSNQEYLGFGVSAHRYVGGVRSSNYRSLQRYMREYLADETLEEIDETTRAKEGLFLGLRLRTGIDLERFRQEYGVDVKLLFSEKLRRLSDGGFLEVVDGHLRLSQQGVLVSNLVIAELV